MNSTDIRAIGSLLRMLDGVKDLNQVYPELRNPKSILAKFIDDLLEDKYKSDDEATLHLYGTSQIPQSYRTLKYRVLERALDSVLDVDVASFGFSEYSAAQLRQMQLHYTSALLLRKANRSVATSIAIKNVNKSREQDNTLSELMHSLVLLTSSSRSNSMAQFSQISLRVRNLIRRFSNELETEVFLDHIPLLDYCEHNNIKKADVANEYLRRANVFLQDTPSHSLTLNVFRLTVAASMFEHDVDRILNTCSVFEKYLADNPKYHQPSRFGELKLSRTYALLQIREIERALMESNDLLSYFNPSGCNFVLAIELRALVLIMSQDYDAFYSFLRRWYPSQSFVVESSFVQERLLLFDAYSVLLQSLGLLTRSGEALTKFRLTTFLNSVPTLYEDKDESNFQCIVLSLAYSVYSADYDAVYNRTQSLRVYLCRYIRSNYHARDQLIIRAFTALSNCSFDVPKFRKQYRRLLDELAMPIAVGSPISMNELIPYNVLFDRLLAIIEERGY